MAETLPVITGRSARRWSFLLDGQRYALPIAAVQEIQQIVAMTEVPETTPGRHRA